MAAVNVENPVNIEFDYLFQKIENLQIALKASSDAYQSALEQAKKDRRKYQAEVDRICAAANLKQSQLQEKIQHYEDQLFCQPSPSQSQVSHQAQQTLPEDFEDPIDIAPNQKSLSTETIKNIDTVSTQTDQDEVVLSNLKKMSRLEGDLSKMDHNQDLLISELNYQKQECLTLQDKITMLTKKMAEVTFANNLDHGAGRRQSLPKGPGGHQDHQAGGVHQPAT